MNKFCPGSQEIKDPEERKQFLIDNADKVVEIDYHKSFDSDEMAKMKTEFAEKHIRIATLEEKIKDYKDEINQELKPLKEEVSAIRENLKSKGKLVHEKCYQFLDYEERMVCIYNSEGILVSSRPATRDEMQRTIQAEIRSAVNQ
ncbi:MAG: hypothetical protein K6A67_08665 [Bacteroidales bacterium]|jgi:phosphoenolpyruvate carboxylase|nr:hypothetical protein [Bacteroidales bacterium]